MGAWRASRIAAVLLLFVWSVPSGALAQDVDDSDPIADVAAEPQDPVAQAREEFAAGVACVAEHETRCALAHFRTALALHDAPTIRYNLASALFELEQYPETARLLESVIGDEETSEEIRGHATTLQTELLEAAGVFEITVVGASEGVDVRVDEDTLPARQRSVPVMPGTHTVRAIRDGETLAEIEATASVGQTVPVELVIAPSPEEVAAQALDEEPSDDTVELWEDWPFWAIVGGGVAAILIVVIAVVVASETAGTQEPVIGDYDPGLIRW